MKFPQKLTLFLFVLLPALLLEGCSLQKDPVSATGFYFDTVIQITLYDEKDKPLLEDCLSMAEHYEKLLSATIEGSDIWNLNHANGSYVTVSDDTLFLLQKALSYAELSEGAVDPTIGTLSGLWNFGSDNEKLVPSDPQIKAALSHVDYHALHIRGKEVCLTDPLAQVDLGFIAKGFIADQMRDYLTVKGVTSGLINLGGNVVVIGSKPDGSDYKIGIQKPFADAGTPALTLSLSDTSVVSSGNYERYFEIDGQLYHHILSTQTGYPADTGLSQVSILCKSSCDADALSTLCFVLGYEKAALLLKDMPEIKAVFLTQSGELLYVNFD